MIIKLLINFCRLRMIFENSLVHLSPRCAQNTNKPLSFSNIIRDLQNNVIDIIIKLQRELCFQIIHAQIIRVKMVEAVLLPTPGDSRVPVLKTSEVRDATVRSALHTITKWWCNMCFCNNINVYVLLRVSTYLSHHFTTRHGCGNKVTIVVMTISQGLTFVCPCSVRCVASHIAPPMCLWVADYGTFESTGRVCGSDGGHRLSLDLTQYRFLLGKWPCDFVRVLNVCTLNGFAPNICQSVVLLIIFVCQTWWTKHT